MCVCKCVHASVCIPGCVCICICSYECTCAYFHVGKYVCVSRAIEVCLQQEAVRAGKICIRCWYSLSQTIPDFSFHGGSLGIFSPSGTVSRQKTKLLIPHARSMSLPGALIQPRTCKGPCLSPLQTRGKGVYKGTGVARHCDYLSPPVLGTLRQENHKSETSLSYIIGL